MPIAFLDINAIERNNFYCVVFVDKQYRGNHLSISLYEKAIEELKNRYINFHVIDSIEINNEASIKTAEKFGFQCHGFEDENTLLYMYEYDSNNKQDK